MPFDLQGQGQAPEPAGLGNFLLSLLLGRRQVILPFQRGCEGQGRCGDLSELGAKVTSSWLGPLVPA